MVISYRGRHRAGLDFHAIDEFTQTFDAAIHATELTCIVAKVEAAGPKGYATNLALLENRFQFQRHIETLERENLKRK